MLGHKRIYGSQGQVAVLFASRFDWTMPVPVLLHHSSSVLPLLRDRPATMCTSDK